jgi:hypothetical protein
MCDNLFIIVDDLLEYFGLSLEELKEQYPDYRYQIIQANGVIQKYIFPNQPTQEQLDGCVKCAALLQFDYINSQEYVSAKTPNFQAGKFSVGGRATSKSNINVDDISISAYQTLLQCGLLYKGLPNCNASQ